MIEDIYMRKLIILLGLVVVGWNTPAQPIPNVINGEPMDATRIKLNSAFRELNTNVVKLDSPAYTPLLWNQVTNKVFTAVFNQFTNTVAMAVVLDGTTNYPSNGTITLSDFITADRYANGSGSNNTYIIDHAMFTDLSQSAMKVYDSQTNIAYSADQLGSQIVVNNTTNTPINGTVTLSLPEFSTNQVSLIGSNIYLITTASVSNMEPIAATSVIGNLGSSSNAPIVIPISNNLVVDSSIASAVATKSYIDAHATIYYGNVNSVGVGLIATNQYQTTYMSNIVSSLTNQYMIYFKCTYWNQIGTMTFRTGGDNVTISAGTIETGLGCTAGWVSTNSGFYGYMMTSTNGAIEMTSTNTSANRYCRFKLLTAKRIIE